MVCRAAREGAASLHRPEPGAGGGGVRGGGARRGAGVVVGETRNSCQHCWFQNQTLLAAVWGFRSDNQSCELRARAPPCLQELGQQDGSLAGRPLHTSSVLDSSLGQVHLVAEAVTPPPSPSPKPCSGHLGAGFQLSHLCSRGKCTRETLQGTLSEAICSRSHKNTGAASLTIEAPSFQG